MTIRRNGRAMEGVDRDDLDVGREVLFESSTLGSLDGGLARDDCAEFCGCRGTRGRWVKGG